MAQVSAIDRLKHQYKNGGMHIRLITWNLAVFLFIQLASLFGSSYGSVENLITRLFTLQSSLGAFLLSPWGLLTSVFSHFSFMHLLFNMVFLYFTGQMFLQFFSGKKLLYTYVFGGIFGGLIQILVGLLPLNILESGALVVGASGSIMAVFIALAVYRPQLKVYLFGVFQVPLFALAILFVLKDVFSIGSNDGVAHFVHLGGALFGFISVRNITSKQNTLNWLIASSESVKVRIMSLFSPRKLRKIEGRKPATKLTDEEFNETKKMTQEQIDAVLDKISRSGYDSLTKKEKEFLFKQSSK